MNSNPETFKSGMLFVKSDDKFQYLGEVKNIKTELSEDDPCISDDISRIVKSLNDLTLSFSITRESAERAAMIFTGLYDEIIKSCTNIKVKHLIKYHKKERVRKKNFNRLIRTLEKGCNKK